MFRYPHYSQQQQQQQQQQNQSFSHNNNNNNNSSSNQRQQQQQLQLQHHNKNHSFATTTDVCISSSSSSSNITTPSEYARLLLQKKFEQEQREEKEHVFQFDENLLDSYTLEVVNAVRNSDMNKLRALYQNGQNFNACNRNGETLLHLACRCCSIEIVQFLIETANANVNVIDSVGRSILHDVCWRHQLNIELMEYIVLSSTINPTFFLLQDKRGHTCFDYCRKEHYTIWIEFLQKHERYLRNYSTTTHHNNNNNSPTTATITNNDDEEEDEEEEQQQQLKVIVNRSMDVAENKEEGKKKYSPGLLIHTDQIKKRSHGEEVEQVVDNNCCYQQQQQSNKRVKMMEGTRV